MIYKRIIEEYTTARERPQEKYKGFTCIRASLRVCWLILEERETITKT